MDIRVSSIFGSHFDTPPPENIISPFSGLAYPYQYYLILLATAQPNIKSGARAPCALPARSARAPRAYVSPRERSRARSARARDNISIARALARALAQRKNVDPGCKYRVSYSRRGAVTTEKISNENYLRGHPGAGNKKTGMKTISEAALALAKKNARTGVVQ